MAAITSITKPIEPTPNGEVISMDSSALAKELAMGAVYTKRGYAIAKEEDKPIIDGLKQRLEEAEKKIKLLEEINKIVKLHPDAPPSRNYEYDCTLFPQDNGNVIIDSVTELANCKRERGKYIIANKTDWYLVYMVLHYFGLFVGTEYEFLDNVLPNVLKYLDNPERVEKLSAKPSNFFTFEKEHPKELMPVDHWGKLLKKEREEMMEAKEEEKRTSKQITVLNRGYNIKMKLYDILIHHDVQVVNR